jgi:hypothetical protein
MSPSKCSSENIFEKYYPEIFILEQKKMVKCCTFVKNMHKTRNGVNIEMFIYDEIKNMYIYIKSVYNLPKT